MYQIHNCSPEAKEFIDPNFELIARPIADPNIQASKYPFRKMQVGHCFIVSYSELKDERDTAKVYSAVSKANKRLLGKKFKLIKHEKENCLEIARII